MAQYENLYAELKARVSFNKVSAEWCDNFAQSYPD